MSVAKHCLVHVHIFGERLLGGLIRYERLHVYFIGYCSYCSDLLIRCVSKKHYKYVNQVIRSCNQFRDPITGATHPRLSFLLKMKHLTAERRVRSIFYWAHVLGLKATVINEHCRQYAQRAVATLQLLLIATRGHRTYTSMELDIIFKEVGRQFFI